MSDAFRYAGPPDPAYTTVDTEAGSLDAPVGGLSGLPVDPSYAVSDDPEPVEDTADELIVTGDEPVELAGPDTDESPATGFATKTELHRMTKDELIDYAGRHGVSTEGTKDEIHERVVDAGKVQVG